MRQGSLRGLSGSKTALLHMSQYAPTLGVGSSPKKTYWTYLIFGRTALWFAALRFPHFSYFDMSSGRGGRSAAPDSSAGRAKNSGAKTPLFFNAWSDLQPIQGLSGLLLSLSTRK